MNELVPCECQRTPTCVPALTRLALERIGAFLRGFCLLVGGEVTRLKLPALREPEGLKVRASSHRLLRLEFGIILQLAAALALFGCGRPQPPAPSPELKSAPEPPSAAAPWFEEVAAQAGVTFRHSSGHGTRFYMPEMVTGGVGLLDFDGDGWLDFFCVNGGALDPSAPHPLGHKLYRNLGHWKFEDVTERAGVGGSGEYGMGCACGDFNNDGRVDLYVSHLNGGLLFRNNGPGSGVSIFTDVTREAGIHGDSWGTSAAWFDYDGDGQLDLMVANYLRWSRETELNCFSRGGRPDYCSPLNYKAPAMDTLYHNRGDGAFENVTRAAGLDQAYGNGLGVACADFNHDGRLDIYVANDGVPNQLWINQGNGRFTEEALIRGCAVNAVGMPRAGMGIAAVDLRQRGSLDIFITHLVGEGNGLFVNAHGQFADVVSPKGPGASSRPFTGFGVGFADFDNDGHLDLYVANGRVKLGVKDLDAKDPYAEPSVLLRGLGQGEFEAVNPQGGVHPPLLATGRGAAFGDLDNDGAMDGVVINRDGPVHLLRNVVPQRGNWILFRMLDRRGSDAINARLRLEAGGRMQFRDVMPNQGYCSSNDPRVHFGLAAARKVDRVAVRWRSGEEEVFGPFDSGHITELRQGGGQKIQGVIGQ